MNELASLGLILLFALLAGHLVTFLRVPEVTGYILAGIALGPSLLGWLSHENVLTLSVLSEVALGLILFSIGSVFELDRIRAMGRPILRVALSETSAAAALVGLGALALGQRWEVALLLGAVAMETGAASTMMVIRECDSSGPLTEALTGVIAVNNILCLIAFSLVATMIDLAAATANPAPWHTAYEAVFPLVWQLVGSAALGYLVGLLLAAWASRVTAHGEVLILLAGCVLLCVGVSILLELSALVASLAVGATMVNLSSRSRRLFEALSQTDPPLYAIFFVIAGADLNLSLLGSMGVVGVAYVIGRGSGKFLGARLGARWSGLPVTVRRHLGTSLLAHAGLAVGLTLTISRRLPELAPPVITVVLAAVVLYEIAGPLGVRLAIMAARENRQKSIQPDLNFG
jgi:Kef-type K+ transport system membrane component KefB